ncbi:hypothetical protein GOODEAATRI_032582, partial [Goodea atripinnis]
WFSSWATRRRRSKLRWITTGSIADLLFILTLLLWGAGAVETWHFGGFLCVSVHAIYTVNLYSTVLILAFISLDRYLAVVRATNSWATRNLLASRVIFVGVWLPAAMMTVPDLVFAQVQDVQNVSSSCYLLAEDAAQSAGSSTICQRIYPAESGLTWTAVFRFQHICHPDWSSSSATVSSSSPIYPEVPRARC